MDLGITLLAVAAGYFIVAISFTRIFGRYVLPGQDVSKAEIPIKAITKQERS